MSIAFVVLTALPPTKGHINLINYARQVGDNYKVVLMTQPHEPMVYERYLALNDAFPGHVQHINRKLPQDPETPGFWDLWTTIMQVEVGVRADDFIVASEPYGQRLAEITGAKFMPYDPYREITPCKATAVRDNPIKNFNLIAHEFQQYLRINVTIFGAESTGKSTLARTLAKRCHGHYFMEWARPYLEQVGSDITKESMTDIWHGQRALEAHSDNFYDKPFAFFDTDLYSTIGYWEFPHWRHIIGAPPEGLIKDAIPSDLYLITKSNIPFEEDPLRYGGDHREASDQYWIDVAETYGLNYVVLEAPGKNARVREAVAAMESLRDNMKNRITYDREGF